MKIEQKGSLWACTLTSGAYSDWTHEVIVVSANTIEEAKNSIKIWAKEEYDNDRWTSGLLFQDGEKWQFKLGDINWDECYGDYKYVDIERLNVVYTKDEIAPPSLHINN